MTRCSPFLLPPPQWPPGQRAQCRARPQPREAGVVQAASEVKKKEKILEMKLCHLLPSSFLHCSLPSVRSLAVLTTQLNERRAPLFRPNTGPSAGARQGKEFCPNPHKPHPLTQPHHLSVRKALQGLGRRTWRCLSKENLERCLRFFFSFLYLCYKENSEQWFSAGGVSRLILLLPVISRDQSFFHSIYS